MSVICDICNAKISSKYILAKHKLTESCQKVKRELEYNNNIINFNNKINYLENKNEELKVKSIEKDNFILENDNIILELESKIKTLEELYKKEKEKSEEYRKIVEKAATKSTKTVNNNNNNTYNRNNYLNYISKEPIKFSELQQNINNLVTTKTIMFDNDDFNEHITKNMLRDENGKDKILCTDINRKNFTYKDEKSGQLVSDPELERLREQLKKGTNNKLIKKDLLDKLIKKYEGTAIDPYNKFYEYLQNIQFGTPFVEHVAKKTYIKTKPDTIEERLSPERSMSSAESIEINISNKNDVDIEDIDNFDEGRMSRILDETLCGESFDEIDKLYHQMKDEFDNE